MNENEPIDVDALRDQFLDKIFDEYVFTLDAEKLVQYAKSCGETASKFTNPDDPDFQAPPTIASSFNPTKDYPDNFPSFEVLLAIFPSLIPQHFPNSFTSVFRFCKCICEFDSII